MHCKTKDRDPVAKVKLIVHNSYPRYLEEYGIQGESFWMGFGGFRKNPRLGWSGNSRNVDYRGQEENLCVPYRNSENNWGLALLKQML